MSHKKSKGQRRAAKVQKRERTKRERHKEHRGIGPVWYLSGPNDHLDDDDAPVRIPDRRAIEGMMWRHVNQMDSGDPALAQAQDIMYDAFGTDDPDERVSIAREALAVSPDCADAHVVLGEEAGSLSEALTWYERAVEAGRRAIGDDFDATVGHFWGVLSTRPYMRARERLAATLWSTGRRDEAVDHYREMLRLNPGDNQGVRDELISCLIELGRWSELDELIRQYDCDSAHWLYSKALRAFQREGDTAAARGFLKRAIKENRHAPVYLAGQRQLPMAGPESYQFGSEEEAVLYARSASGAWRSVPGAIAWLRKVADLGLKEPEENRPRFSNTQLKKLPLSGGEFWRVMVRELYVGKPGDEHTTWAVGILTSETRDFVGTDLFDEPPDSSEVLDVICRTFLEPLAGNPRRPELIEFVDEDLFAEVAKQLRRLGIEVEMSEHAEELKESGREFLQRQQAPPDDRPLDELPQEVEEVWQFDCRQMGIWVPDDDGNSVRPWALLLTSPTHDVIIGTEIAVQQPSLERMGDLLERSMRRPMAGDPRRPGLVQVRSNDQRLLLEVRLNAARVACEASNELEHWDSVYAGLANHMEGQRKVAPFTELPGVSKEQINSFFEAAAQYFRAAPWRRTPVDAKFEFTCDLSPTWWDAVVIGQNGQTLGLAMYEEGRGLADTLREPENPDAAMEKASALSLTFGEQHEMAAADLDAAEQFGWPVAAPEAYPVVLRVRPGNELTSPTADELRALEAAVRGPGVRLATRIAMVHHRHAVQRPGSCHANSQNAWVVNDNRSYEPALLSAGRGFALALGYIGRMQQTPRAGSFRLLVCRYAHGVSTPI